MFQGSQASNGGICSLSLLGGQPRLFLCVSSVLCHQSSSDGGLFLRLSDCAARSWSLAAAAGSACGHHPNTDRKKPAQNDANMIESAQPKHKLNSKGPRLRPPAARRPRPTREQTKTMKSWGKGRPRRNRRRPSERPTVRRRRRLA